MKMRITTPTWGKQSTAPAKSLADKDKHFFAADSYEIVKWSDTAQNHQVIEFDAEIAGRKRWIFYGDHVDCEGEPKSLLIKGVPYYSQRDNSVGWWRTCNSSTHAMLLKFLKPGAIAGDDDYFARFVQPVGDTTDHAVHTEALKRCGIQSQWRTDLDYDDLNKSLELGYPVPIGVLHSGSMQNPCGGHILLIIGKEGSDYIAHDPWGEGFGANYDTNHNGASVRYPVSSLSARWLPDGNNSGWGRIISGVE